MRETEYGSYRPSPAMAKDGSKRPEAKRPTIDTVARSKLPQFPGESLPARSYTTVKVYSATWRSLKGLGTEQHSLRQGPPQRPLPADVAAPGS